MAQSNEFKHFCPRCRRHYEADRTVCPRDGERLLSVPMVLPRPGSVFDKRYVLLETIGKGGMATIYRGWDVKRKSQCALKVLNTRFSSEERAVGQFFTEARMARRLKHPNIVDIYDFGRTDVGYLYIAMELLEGQTLSRLVRGGGALPIARAARLFAQIVDALHAAHARGTVHRDLKPENVFVCEEEGREVAKLLDFGIAQFVGTLNYTSREICGTPAYMSPEQIRGKTPRVESDLYSAGVVLFEMVTGRQPFTGASHREILKRQLKARPPRLTQQIEAGTKAQPLEELVERLMRKDPELRPRDAETLRRDLNEACDLMGIEAPCSLPAIRLDTLEPTSLPVISYLGLDNLMADAKSHCAMNSEKLEEVLDTTVRPAIRLAEDRAAGSLDSPRPLLVPIKKSHSSPDCLVESYSLLHVRFLPTEETEEDVEELRYSLGTPLEAWFQRVEELGGLVCYDSGSDLKVLFGYLTEDDDYPLKAVEAGMLVSREVESYRSTHSIPCTVKAGVATGTVYADSAVEGPLDWMIKGSRIDLAVRLSRLAPPGGVITCQETAMHAQPDAKMCSLEPLSTRGGEVIETFLLQGLAQETQTHIEIDLESIFQDNQQASAADSKFTQ